MFSNEDRVYREPERRTFHEFINYRRVSTPYALKNAVETPMRFVDTRVGHPDYLNLGRRSSALETIDGGESYLESFLTIRRRGYDLREAIWYITTD